MELPRLPHACSSRCGAGCRVQPLPETRPASHAAAQLRSMLAADAMRLLLLCAAFGAGTAAALAPQDASWAPALWANGSLLAAAGGVGILGATTLIHIYITPIKRALQVLAALGCAGGTWLALQHSDVPLPQVSAGWDGWSAEASRARWPGAPGRPLEQQEQRYAHAAGMSTLTSHLNPACSALCPAVCGRPPRQHVVCGARLCSAGGHLLQGRGERNDAVWVTTDRRTKRGLPAHHSPLPPASHTPAQPHLSAYRFLLMPPLPQPTCFPCSPCSPCSSLPLQFCYEKRESFILSGLIPLLCLLHLTGLMPELADKGALQLACSSH